MLDFDLAELYGVETRVLNQAVKRNIDRFPSDFMFRLTANEWGSMLSQNVMTCPLKLKLHLINQRINIHSGSYRGKN